ncbi:trypsin-like peptidase domain-containing protein [Nonomuraea sediminis]|uniref:trypsin-like peptidase domain-containing protein n=1 Tax=Nonomuraea sediminis TaxID=2835864 RepID=UPI001BDD17B0|nr:trypsin-like peptidase domain-containing protein [Nonomuraea sediminis]
MTERSGRVVEVYADGGYGSGYAIGDDLVLTAAHVLADGPACQVRRQGDDGWMTAEVAWRGTDGMLDAALVRVSTAPWRDAPDKGALRWGRVKGLGVPCTACGYPKAQAEPDGSRPIETMTGTISTERAQRYDIDVVSAKPLAGESGWRGMSGAAVFGPGRVQLGVVIADPVMYGSARLHALPVRRLLEEEAFARLVGAVEVEDVEDRGTVTELDNGRYLEPPYLPPAADAPDYQLIQARHGRVAFVGRERELHDLVAWCAGSGLFSAATVSGAGGAGKTRLGAQLCVEMAGRGWSAGFADARGLTADLTSGVRVELVWPTLLVADYPDRLTDPVIALIKRLGSRVRGPRLRLLLVDRSPAADEVTWWRKLNRDTDGLLRRSTRTTIALGDGGLGPEDVRRHAEAAARAFGGGMPYEGLPETSPLLVHLAVLSGEVRRTPQALLQDFLDREWRRWEGRLPAHHIADLGEEDVQQAAALVTLTAPTREEAADLLAALPGLEGSEQGRRRRISGWLAEVFPGEPALAPLKPDPVAEQLLDTTPELARLVLAVHDHPACTGAHLAQLFDVLRLAAPQRANAQEALRGLLVARLDELVDTAAAEPYSQLPGLLEAALLLSPGAELAEAAARVPRPPVPPSGALARLRCSITELAVSNGSLAGAELADALTDLAAYRAACNELPAAQDAAERALALAERLDAVRLARARYNLGTCLAMRGLDPERADGLLIDAAASGELDPLLNLASFRADRGDQRTAVRVYRQALNVYLDGRGHHLLDTVSEAFGHLERDLRVDRPLPAVRDGYRPLTGASPDTRDRYGSMLLLAGRLCPGLAEHTPDVLRNALMPLLAPRLARNQALYAAEDFAEVLRAVSEVLTNLGELEVAVVPAAESVALLRRFIHANPDLRERLALGLRLLGKAHHRVGNLEAALANTAESVDCHADLPTMGLADALEQLADLQVEAGRPAEAVAALRRVVPLYRQLDERSMLANAELALGTYLAELGSPDEALPVLRDSAELFAELSRSDPHELEGHALALTMLGTLVTATGGPAATLDMAEQAVEITAALARSRPERMKDHAQALVVLSNSVGTVGRIQEGYDLAARAVELYRAHDMDEPTLLSWGLTTMSQWAMHLQRPEEGIERAREALEAIDDLADTDSVVRTDRGIGLAMLAAALQANLRPQEAVPLAEQAIDLLIDPSLTTAGIDVILAEAMTTLGLSRMMAGSVAEAIEPAVAARQVLGHHPHDNPLVAGIMARSYFCEGVSLNELGRPQEALERLAEAERIASGNVFAQPLVAAALTAMASCHVLLGRPDLALESADRSLAMPSPGEHAAGRVATAQVHFVRGTALLQLARLDEAVAALARAAELFGSADPMLAFALPHASAVVLLAQARLGLGDAAAAAEGAAEGIEMLRVLGAGTPQASAVLAGSYATALSVRLFALTQLGEPAGELTVEAVTSLRAVPGLEFQLAQALCVRGAELAQEGDLEAAAAMVAESVELFRAFGADAAPMLASAERQLGFCLMELERPREALPVLSESASLFAQVANPMLELERIEVEQNLGYCLLDLGDRESAVPHLRTALELLEPLAAGEQGLLPELISVLMALADSVPTAQEALSLVDRALALQEALAALDPGEQGRLLGELRAYRAEVARELEG